MKAVTVDSLSGSLLFPWIGLVESTPLMLALDIMQSLRGTIKSGVVHRALCVLSGDITQLGWSRVHIACAPA